MAIANMFVKYSTVLFVRYSSVLFVMYSAQNEADPQQLLICSFFHSLAHSTNTGWVPTEH